MSVVMGVSGATAMAYATSGLGHSTRIKADQQSFALAEAGLNNAYSILYNSSKPTMSDAVPETAQSLESGAATWSGSYDSNSSTWTLTGIGRVRSPTHGQDLVRRVTAQVQLGTSTHGDSNNAVWNYLYSDSQSGCMNVGNSVNINVPLYVK